MSDRREKNRGILFAFAGFLRPGKAHCRSLGFARDDKGRAVTYLYFRESDGKEKLPIRIDDYNFQTHPEGKHSWTAISQLTVTRRNRLGLCLLETTYLDSLVVHACAPPKPGLRR